MSRVECEILNTYTIHILMFISFLLGYFLFKTLKTKQMVKTNASQKLLSEFDNFKNIHYDLDFNNE